MPLLLTGRDWITARIVQNTSPADVFFDSTGAWIWVGSGSADHAATQTFLQGGGTFFTASMESGYPILSTNNMQHRAIFSTDQANFDWMEWGLKNATVSSTGTGYMLNRARDTGLGSKNSNQSWQITTSATVTT
jgi:hypothetical protein